MKFAKRRGPRVGRRLTAKKDKSSKRVANKQLNHGVDGLWGYARGALAQHTGGLDDEVK
jgi:hypothetical protein